MIPDEAGKAVRAVCDELHDALGISDKAMRYVITVEVDPEVMPDLGTGGVIISDVPTEVAARMALDTMMMLFERMGIEVGMLDLSEALDAAAAKPGRVGARPAPGRRPGRKRRGR
jgi:hypothetical protein